RPGSPEPLANPRYQRATSVNNNRHLWRPAPPAAPVRTPEEVVAGKITPFAANPPPRKGAIAERLKNFVAEEVDRFVDAVAAGQWDELNARFETLQQLRRSGDKAEALQTLWGPILETLLVAECAHDWPAQRLLDYGNSILGSLKPGMIYVGGTD